MDQDVLRGKLAAALKGRFRGRLHVDRPARFLYSTDGSIFMVEPLAAAVPQGAEDVALLVAACRELGIGVHPRGAGSGLAGESLGEGVVVDLHPRFQTIRDLDLEARTVRAAAGVTLGRLNASLAPHGLMFGPDPASGARATIGGMIGTNATGAHSLQYGYTGGHLLEAAVIGPEGEAFVLKPGAPAGLPGLWRAASALCLSHADKIARAYPAQPRNRCGYDLRQMTDAAWCNPLTLLAGAEGTLGLVTEAKLSLVPIPAASTLAMLPYDDLTKAAQAVPGLLGHGPAAIELIGRAVIEAGRAHRPRLADLIPPTAQAILLVEWTGADEEEARVPMRAACGEERRLGLAFDVREGADPQQRALLSLIRREAEALLMNLPGRMRAVSFVEDTAVAPGRLAEWVEVKRRLFAAHKLEWATFGHAAAGELHTKVFVDLREPESYKRLVAMAEELYGEALRLKGTISGEHGDGLLRSPFIRKQYPELYPVFEELKRTLDPQGVLNPGRKTAAFAQHPALDRTRLSGRQPNPAFQPVMEVGREEFAYQSALCHGCGSCRDLSQQVRMCPLFKLSSEEAASPRAKGNLARLTLFGPLELADRTGPVARQVARLCFNCQMCRSECPTHVDIPGLVLELKAEQARAGGLSRGERLTARLGGLSRLGQTVAPLANAMMKSPACRAALEALGGVHREAPLPPFAHGSFAARARTLPRPATERQAVYYCDTQVLRYDHALGLDFIRLLGAAGVEALPFTKGESLLTALDVGRVHAARRAVERQVAQLFPLAEAGRPIVCSEPSAALMLRQEWPRLLNTPQTRAVAQAVREGGAFLAGELGRNSGLSFAPLKRRMAYHAPCHLLALKEEHGFMELLKYVPELEVVPVEAGCCGIAGAWGLLKENRERSLQIGKALFETLQAGGFDGVLSECSACRLQIAAATGLPVFHPASVLAGALQGTP